MDGQMSDPFLLSPNKMETVPFTIKRRELCKGIKE
jgi:hypothetical protein